jgi:hypothetical protein
MSDSSGCIGYADRLNRMTDATARSLLLVVNSVCFGTLWGVMAAAPQGGGGAGAVAGAIVGVLASPIAVLALRRRTIGRARWTWIGATTAVAAAMAISGASPLVSVLAILGTYVASCLFAMMVNPELVELVPGTCHKCGYDISGISGPCPECGTPTPL